MSLYREMRSCIKDVQTRVSGASAELHAMHSILRDCADENGQISAGTVATLQQCILDAVNELNEVDLYPTILRNVDGSLVEGLTYHRPRV